MLWARRRDFVGRGLLAAVVGLTSVWAWILMRRSPTWMPELRGAVLVGGLAAALGLLAWGSINNWARCAVAGTALVACLAGPAAYTLDTVATPHSGAIPSAGPAVTTGGRFGPGGGLGGGPGGPGPGGGRFSRPGVCRAPSGRPGPPAGGAGQGSAAAREPGPAVPAASVPVKPAPEAEPGVASEAC